MNRHRSDIKAFNDLVESYHIGRKRSVAYELAESEWIERSGSRRFKSYKHWHTALRVNAKRTASPKQPKAETVLFFEIFHNVSSQYRTARENYDEAESVYINQYGLRRYSSYDCFIMTRARQYRTNRLKKAA